MKKNIFPIIFTLIINISNSQVFIPLDLDTHEFIDEVQYSLFLNKKLIFNALSENKNITKIDSKINYDSISFSRLDYKPFGINRNKLDTIIFLEKKIIYLDEVVVVAKNNLLTIGETNRFVKKQSKSIAKDLYFGIIYNNKFKNNIIIDKIAFFTEKIFYKTLYKINFYEVEETSPIKGNQFANLGNLLYSTDILSIDKKDKNKVEVDINQNLILIPNKSVFISIQLIDYLDEENNIIKPPNEKFTKIKFQLSNEINYYSKTIDLITKETSESLMNINRMINYDFAKQFFLKPHKSILVTPAIILFAKEW